MKKSLLTAACLIFIAGLWLMCKKQPDQKATTWILGSSSPEDTVTQIFADKFAEEVSRLSGGSIEVKTYHNGTIGSDRELLESCIGGDIPFIVQNTAPQVSFIPKLAIFDLPLAFDTIEEFRTAVDDLSFYTLINDAYKERGIRLLQIADQGFRVMTSNREITSLTEFTAIKIRTMENRYHLAFWKALGANPTPMSFNEVYIGLQQGTLDAQENPYEVIVSSRLYEQQNYIIETNHLPHTITLVMNDTFYDNLDESTKQLVNEASTLAKTYARTQSDHRITEKIQLIQQYGTQIISLPAPLIEELKTLSHPIHTQIRQTVGDALYNAYLSPAE